MTNQQHPITPPPELVQQWCEQLFGCPDEPEIDAYELARLAAQWGAQQELEACVKWLIVQNTRSAKWFDPPARCLCSGERLAFGLHT